MMAAMSYGYYAATRCHDDYACAAMPCAAAARRYDASIFASATRCAILEIFCRGAICRYAKMPPRFERRAAAMLAAPCSRLSLLSRDAAMSCFIFIYFAMLRARYASC